MKTKNENITAAQRKTTVHSQLSQPLHPKMNGADPGEAQRCWEAQTLDTVGHILKENGSFLDTCAIPAELLSASHGKETHLQCSKQGQNS